MSMSDCNDQATAKNGVESSVAITRLGSPQLSNPNVSLPLHTLYEVPHIISDDEAADLAKALENQYYREWTPEGYDRRHRVQRYSSLDEADCSDGDGNITEGDGEDGQVSMEETFGWIFDRIVSHSDPDMMLRRPFEVEVIEHTPSSVRSPVNTFEQNILSPCRQEQNNQQGSNNEEKQSPCNCYIAQLTLMNNAIQYIEKPANRELEHWNLATPTENHHTEMIMGQNGVVVKTGESLWNWRGRISNIQEKSDAATNALCQGMTGLDLDKKKKKQLSKSNNKHASDKKCIIVTFRGIRQPEPTHEPKTTFPHEVKPTLPLAKLLTIIVTTSPIRSNPSTEMLENTFATFSFAGEEFAYECPKVIICDGCRILDEESKSDQEEKKDDLNGPKIKKYANVKQTLRNGIATTDQAKNYNGFISRLRKLCEQADLPSETKNPFRNTDVVELEERHGYGFALRHALYNCVSTPYVCVIQHDRTFMRPTPIKEVVSAMENEPERKIKYVGMSMRSNLLYRDIFGGKYGRRAVNELETMIQYPRELCFGENLYGENGKSVQSMVPPKTDKRRKILDALKKTYRGSHSYRTYDEWTQSAEGAERLQNDDNFHQLSLTPTVLWYDNTHVVDTAHYRDFIFNPQHKMVARGGFVEDKLSPCIVRSCERLGLTEGHAKFGSYLLDDHSGAAFTGHLDGGSYMTAELWDSKTDAHQRRLNASVEH